MRLVEFIKSCPPYNPGETAGFDDTEAERLVSRGTARFRDARGDAQAKAVADKEAARAAAEKDPPKK